MSIRLLSALLLTIQIVVGVAVTIIVAVFVFRIVTGAPFTADWPVGGEHVARSYPLANHAGTIRIDSGMLSLVGTDWRPELARVIAMTLFGIGAYFAVERMRTILDAIASGAPFADDVVRGLRVIAWLAFGWAALDVVTAIVLQPLMLSIATPVDPAIHLGGAFANPATHVRMMFEFDFLKLAAGLFALALAQAFAIGRGLAEDNAAIV